MLRDISNDGHSNNKQCVCVCGLKRSWVVLREREYEIGFSSQIWNLRTDRFLNWVFSFTHEYCLLLLFFSLSFVWIEMMIFNNFKMNSSVIKMCISTDNKHICVAAVWIPFVFSSSVVRFGLESRLSIMRLFHFVRLSTVFLSKRDCLWSEPI